MTGITTIHDWITMLFSPKSPICYGFFDIRVYYYVLLLKVLLLCITLLFNAFLMTRHSYHTFPFYIFALLYPSLLTECHSCFNDFLFYEQKLGVISLDLKVSNAFKSYSTHVNRALLCRLICMGGCFFSLIQLSLFLLRFVRQSIFMVQ